MYTIDGIVCMYNDSILCVGLRGLYVQQIGLYIE